MATTKNMRYLGVNLTQEVGDLHQEKYKILKKETEEDKSKWKHILCSWIGRRNIIKMSIIPKAICRFNGIPTKIPMVYFTDLEQIFQKFIWNQKLSQRALALEIGEQSWRSHNIKQYYKAIVIETSWYWHKNWHIDQWNRTKSQQINLCLQVN